MNKQIFAPRGDKSKETRKRENKEQLTDPRKACNWKKLRQICEPRQNGTDTFFLPGIRNWLFSNKKANVTVLRKNMQFICYTVSHPSVYKRDKFFLKAFGHLCTATTVTVRDASSAVSGTQTSVLTFHWYSLQLCPNRFFLCMDLVRLPATPAKQQCTLLIFKNSEVHFPLAIIFSMY